MSRKRGDVPVEAPPCADNLLDRAQRHSRLFQQHSAPSASGAVVRKPLLDRRASGRAKVRHNRQVIAEARLRVQNALSGTRIARGQPLGQGLSHEQVIYLMSARTALGVAERRD
jgi:hypothetical protein